MNGRLDVVRAQIFDVVPPAPKRTALLAQLEVSRAQADTQINQALAACP